MNYIGFDIGGTKSAVIIADMDGNMLYREAFSTTTPEETLSKLFAIAREKSHNPVSVGFSCGGPLDESLGIILSPPNLPGWNQIMAVRLAQDYFHVPARLCNDANACALAEWRYGAGKGCSNMIFLTFGTGMGAGLILNGKLYSGTNGNAGEIGHIRISDDGPIGYRKEGSFEGFCSGGGIRKLAQRAALKALEKREPTSYCKEYADLENITAKTVAEAAYRGDPAAVEVYNICAQKLGEGLAVLIDVLNPEAIIIGSIFERSEKLLRPLMEHAINAEALPQSRKVCKVVPAMLGDRIGDYAAIAVAMMAAEEGEKNGFV